VGPVAEEGDQEESDGVVDQRIHEDTSGHNAVLTGLMPDDVGRRERDNVVIFLGYFALEGQTLQPDVVV